MRAWRTYRSLALGLAFMLTLGACSGGPDVPSGAGPVQPASKFFEVQRYFCSPVIQDRFMVGYMGQEPLSSPIHFFVVCHKGDTIFREDWKASDMVTAPDSVLTGDSAQVKALEAAMKKVLYGDLAWPDSLAPLPARQFGFRMPDGRLRVLAFRSGKAVEISPLGLKR